ncbi:MAG: hypothetical protein ICV81_21280 [Flavisolibacter sp.]|nr:hypothetical protein [Flavisolibacter sp.]MBD0285986.1 hypothetical protein [Flavisolibacter sp.]
MNSLLDLRFVIGLFFLIIGILLLLHSFLAPGDMETVNRWCGIVFIVFAALMLILSRQKDESDEVLEHDEHPQPRGH